MMLTPWGPRAVPTGGAGVAAPAWSCTLTRAAIFFFGGIASSSLSRGHDGAGAPATWFCRASYSMRSGSGFIPGRVALGFPIPLSPPRVPSALSLVSPGFGSPGPRKLGPGASDLLDLGEAELDRGLPAEDL